MNSPPHRHQSSLLVNESETDLTRAPSARHVVTESVEINRQVFGQVLSCCVVYETIVSIVSIAIASYFGQNNDQQTPANSCQQYFPAWIVCCCTVYLGNLALNCFRYYWSEPTRLPFTLQRLARLNRVGKIVQLLFLAVVITGHVLVIGEFHCHKHYSWLYYTSLFLLLHCYIVFIICVFLFVLATICSPCFLYLVRPFLKTSSRGISRSEIETLESDTANNLHLLTGACPICLENYKADDQIIVLRPCGHRMHKKCLRSWLQINASCPLCRDSVCVNNDPPV